MDNLIIFSAKYLYLAAIALTVIVWVFKKPIKRKQLLTLGVISLPLSLLVTKILGYFIYHPRPFVIEHIKPLIDHTADNGFPSDHTLLVMALASVIFTFDRKMGIILFIIGIIVGIARVIAKVHYPEDIMASTLIALVTTYLVNTIFRKLQLLT